jgi:hypothetical protein
MALLEALTLNLMVALYEGKAMVIADGYIVTSLARAVRKSVFLAGTPVDHK